MRLRVFLVRRSEVRQSTFSKTSDGRRLKPSLQAKARATTDEGLFQRRAGRCRDDASKTRMSRGYIILACTESSSLP